MNFAVFQIKIFLDGRFYASRKFIFAGTLSDREALPQGRTPALQGGELHFIIKITLQGTFSVILGRHLKVNNIFSFLSITGRKGLK